MYIVNEKFYLVFRGDIIMISKKLKEITPSYTIDISMKVANLKQSGKDIIDFSIGEPDFEIPAESKHAINTALVQGKTKYDKVAGLVKLRKAIVHKLKTENSLLYDIDNIVVSSGAKHAITNTLIALLNPNDEVLIPKPYWVSYPEMVKLVGGKPVFIDTQKENGYRITPKIMERKLSDKTKILFLTNPSNPTGMVYSHNELLSIGEFCVKNNIYILADEIYERICFEDTFTSIASISETIKNNTITINGFSKSFAMTGLRIGYSASNKEISKTISMIQGHLVSHPSTISQFAAAEALNQSSSALQTMHASYKKRRALAISILNTIPDISYIYPQGAFYIFIDVSALKSKIAYKKSFSVQFSNQLLEKAMVAVVPGIAFGMDDFIRISYACSEEALEIGLNRLKLFIRSLIQK